jgi:tetratricopeptide (TPR) repeat protein
MRLLPGMLFFAVQAFAALAFAQVQPVRTGQSLDANYQMGSGGYNRVNGGVGGVNSQLYVNGQVTGLNSFQGRHNVVMNQLQMNVPSNDLSTFTKQSVGTTDVLNQRVYQVSPYYSPSVLVNSAQTIAAAGGFAPNQAGYVPGRYIDNSAAQKLFIEATADYKPLMPDLSRANGSAAALIVPVEGGSPSAPRPDQMFATPAGARPGASALFAAPSAQERDKLANELLNVDRRIDFSLDAQASGANGPGNNTDQSAGASNQGLNQPGNTQQMQSRSQSPADATALRNQNSLNKANQQPGRNEIINVPQNQDVFVDMLIGLRQSKTGQASPRAGNQTPANAQNQGADLTQAQPGSPAGAADGSLRRPGVWKGQDTPADASDMLNYGTGAKSRVEYIPGKGVIVHSLAGTGNDMFNRQMASAEISMKAKKFYDAAEQYRTAAAVNPSNPLAWVGMGISLLAAREPSSASISFQRAMTAFPPLMEVRLDVNSMLNAEIFRTQLFMLDQRIDTGPDANNQSLLFLAAYLHYSVGQDDIAKDLARRLQAKSPESAVISSFVEFILTGKRPAQLQGLSQSAQQ